MPVENSATGLQTQLTVNPVAAYSSRPLTFVGRCMPSRVHQTLDSAISLGLYMSRRQRNILSMMMCSNLLLCAFQFFFSTVTPVSCSSLEPRILQEVGIPEQLVRLDRHILCFRFHQFIGSQPSRSYVIRFQHTQLTFCGPLLAQGSATQSLPDERIHQGYWPRSPRISGSIATHRTHQAILEARSTIDPSKTPPTSCPEFTATAV